MKKSIKCDFGDICFLINSYKSKDYEDQLKHVNEFYIPCKVPKNEPKEISIDYVTNKEIYNKYLDECKKREGKLYQSFENQVHKEIECNSKKVYLINNEEYICIKDNDLRYIILTDGRESGIKWPFRILRELLVREREDSSFLFMHGTSLKINNRNLLLLGNSGSGKTTLAINMLSEGINQNEFMSNDRVFINEKTMKYFPIPVVFASGTAKNNKFLDDYFKRTRLFEKRINKIYEETGFNDKVPVPLTDIPRIFSNVELKPENDIDTILLPKIRFDMGPNFKICELNEREKWIALERTCFTPFDSESLRLEWVRKRKKNIDEITENRYDTIHDLIKNKQILKLEYGPESEQTKIIEDIDR